MTSNRQISLPGIPLSRKKTPARKVFQHPVMSAEKRGEVAAEMVLQANKLFVSAIPRHNKQAERILYEAGRFSRCGSEYRGRHCEIDDLGFYVPLSCRSRLCEHCGNILLAQLRQPVLDAVLPLFSRKRPGWGVHLLTLTLNKERFGGRLPERLDIQRFYGESLNFLRLFYGKYKARITPSGKVIEDSLRHRTKKRPGGKVERIRRDPKLIADGKGGTREEWRTWRGAGYIASMELGKDNNNLHLHAVVYGPYIHQRILSTAWQKLTGDSYIVDVRSVQNAKKAVWYVLKYIVKPPATGDSSDLAAYGVMLKGTRRLRSGGIFFNLIHRENLPKLTFACPFCGGYLTDLGTMETSTRPAETQSLYPLLKEVRNRGSPLKLPPHADGLKPFERSFLKDSGLYDYVKKVGEVA